jgi:hypothetical protein
MMATDTVKSMVISLDTIIRHYERLAQVSRSLLLSVLVASVNTFCCTSSALCNEPAVFCSPGMARYNLSNETDVCNMMSYIFTGQSDFSSF